MRDRDFELPAQYDVDVGGGLVLMKDCLFACVCLLAQKVLELKQAPSRPRQKVRQRVEELDKPVHRFLLNFAQHFLVFVTVHHCERAVRLAHYSSRPWFVLYQCELAETLPHL